MYSPGFAGHAELAGAEAGFDVFGGVAGECDFEIVDERGAVHGDAGDEAAVHQIDEDRAEADLDDVAADAPEDGMRVACGRDGWRSGDCADLPPQECSEVNPEIL